MTMKKTTSTARAVISVAGGEVLFRDPGAPCWADVHHLMALSHTPGSDAALELTRFAEGVVLRTSTIERPGVDRLSFHPRHTDGVGCIFLSR